MPRLGQDSSAVDTPLSLRRLRQGKGRHLVKVRADTSSVHGEALHFDFPTPCTSTIEPGLSTPLQRDRWQAPDVAQTQARHTKSVVNTDPWGLALASIVGWVCALTCRSRHPNLRAGCGFRRPWPGIRPSSACAVASPRETAHIAQLDRPKGRPELSRPEPERAPLSVDCSRGGSRRAASSTVKARLCRVPPPQESGARRHAVGHRELHQNYIETGRAAFRATGRLC